MAFDQTAMSDADVTSQFAGFLSLTYHEARNVRFLLKRRVRRRRSIFVESGSSRRAERRRGVKFKTLPGVGGEGKTIATLRHIAREGRSTS